jgi:hypothetical protein
MAQLPKIVPSLSGLNACNAWYVSILIMPPFLSYIPSSIKQVDSFSVVLSQRHFILQAVQAVHNGVWYVFQAGSIEEYD